MANKKIDFSLAGYVPPKPAGPAPPTYTSPMPNLAGGRQTQYSVGGGGVTVTTPVNKALDVSAGVTTNGSFRNPKLTGGSAGFRYHF